MLPANTKDKIITKESLCFALNEGLVEKARDLAQKIDSIEKRCGLDYNNFFINYLVPNKPVILTDLHSEFLCTEKWTLNDSNVLKPNFDYLVQTFGGSTVNVAQCNEQQYNDQKRLQMKVSEYIEYWKTRIGHRNEVDSHQTDRPRTSDYLDASLLYLKDWHLIQQYAQHDVYRLPAVFSEDWLNDFWDQLNLNDDYRFVYMGPKHSWTPLHADVLRSYSWSTNICGRKLWIFFPPDQEQYFKDAQGNTVYDVLGTIDEMKFPDFKKCSPIKVIQEAGETIYVPSGWFHQVHNLADTISINHNWFNACNLDLCWNFMKNDLTLLEKYIAHIRSTFSEDEYLEHCQVMLRASAGIDFLEFFMLLTQITAVQMTRVIGSQKARQNFNLELFNLSKITQVLKLILKEEYMIKYKTLSDNIIKTIEKIENFVRINLHGES